MGQYALQLADIATRGATDGPEAPEMRLDQMPVVSRFLRDDPPRTTRYVTEYYRMKREVDKAYSTIRHYGTTRRGEEAMELLEKKAGKAGLYRSFQAAGRAMSEYRKVETQIRVSREMSPGEKRRRLDKILRSRNKLAKQMVKSAPATSRLIEKAFKASAEERRKITR